MGTPLLLEAQNDRIMSVSFERHCCLADPLNETSKSFNIIMELGKAMFPGDSLEMSYLYRRFEQPLL